MKIFICGQKSFGAEVLKALLREGHTITGVSAAPQLKRYDKLKVEAIHHKIPLINDASNVKSADIPEGTELIISAHSHWYISDKCLKKVKYGGIGFHPSLLPRHRGRDAVRWAVAMGDAITGASVYWLDDIVDGGDILLQKHIFIDKGWDYHDLWRRIFPIGVNLIVEAVRLIEGGKAPREPQDERFKTWEPPFDPYRRLQRNELIMLC